MEKRNLEDSQRIFQRALQEFGFDEHASTDPAIVAKMLKELKLDDFVTNNHVMRDFFVDLKTKPIKLGHLISNIEKALVEKHPAIIDFLEIALEKKYFKNTKTATRSLYLTFILERLTSAMSNNHEFFLEAYSHYRSKAVVRGMDSKHVISTFFNLLGITRSFFETIKALSVDPIMCYFRLQKGLGDRRATKKELKDLLKNREINFVEFHLMSPIHNGGVSHIGRLVELNIYEAGITDYKNDLRSNSIAAFALCEEIRKLKFNDEFVKKAVLPESDDEKFYSSICDKENCVPITEYSQSWVSLYISWNAAFVVGNMDNIDLLIPKLLIPTLIDSDPEDFMVSRAISLWLSINHYLFRIKDKNVIHGPDNRKEIAQVWGEINKKYALELSKKEIHEDSKILNKHFNRFFSHPVVNWLKLVLKF